MKSLLAAIMAVLFSISAAFAAVNANTASVDELQSVAGIGPTIAQRIVDERRNGPFKGLDDLQARVKGVGEASIRKMAAAGLTVGGASRARAEVKGAKEAAPAVMANTAPPGAGTKDASRKTVAAKEAMPVPAAKDAPAKAIVAKDAPMKDAAPKATAAKDAMPVAARKDTPPK